MADQMTKEDFEKLGGLIKELRAEVDGKSDETKVARINDQLDELEVKNQAVVAELTEAKNTNRELTELKEFLASGAAEAQEKEAEAVKRISELEVAIAKGEARGNKSKEDWVESAEFKAYNRWMAVGGSVADLEEEHKVLLRSDSDVDGGFMTTEELDTQMIKKITEISAMRSVARVRTIGQKSIRMVVRNTLPESFYEGEAEEDQLGQTKYDSEEMFTYRHGVTVPVTKDLLMDSNWNMDSEIMTDASESMAQKEGNKFILGTGAKEPEGFLVHPDVISGARSSVGSSVIDADDFLLIQGDLKVGYNASFILNRRTLAAARILKGSTNNDYLWSPALDGPAANMIAGASYIVMNDMPNIATDALCVAYGDWFKAYTIVDRAGLTVIRDDLTRKRNAIVEFTFQRWNNGQVVLAEAIKVLITDA